MGNQHKRTRLSVLAVLCAFVLALAGAIFARSTPAQAEEDVVYLCAGASEGGMLTLTGGDFTNEDARCKNFAFEPGTEVTLTATPDDGYIFDGFYTGIVGESGFVEDYDSSQEKITSEKVYTFNLNADTDIYALFRKPDVVLYFMSSSF